MVSGSLAHVGGLGLRRDGCELRLELELLTLGCLQALAAVPRHAVEVLQLHLRRVALRRQVHVLLPEVLHGRVQLRLGLRQLLDLRAQGRLLRLHLNYY